MVVKCYQGCNIFTQATNSRSDPFRRSLTFCLKLHISPSQLKSDLSHFCDQQLKLFLHFPLPLQNFPSNGDLLLESSSRFAQHAKHSWVSSATCARSSKEKVGFREFRRCMDLWSPTFHPFDKLGILLWLQSSLCHLQRLSQQPRSRDWIDLF